MKVNLLYFAAAREQAGTKAEALELRDGATAGDALAAACAAHPGLSSIAGQLRLAVDQQFAAPGLALREGAEVALIPPVAGGAGASPAGRSPARSAR
ncbi:MAG: hypothetical protein NVSMB23_11730 [Myxococcales bacterium]